MIITAYYYNCCNKLTIHFAQFGLASPPLAPHTPHLTSPSPTLNSPCLTQPPSPFPHPLPTDDPAPTSQTCFFISQSFSLCRSFSPHSSTSVYVNKPSSVIAGDGVKTADFYGRPLWKAPGLKPCSDHTAQRNLKQPFTEWS